MSHTEFLHKEDFFKALIENGSEILTMFDKDCSVVYRSPANERILGYAPSENPSINLELIHPEDRDNVIDVFKKSLKDPGKPFLIALKIKAKSGVYLSFEGSITNMLHVEGVNAIVSNYFDITKRKQAEEKLIHTNEKFSALVNTVHGIVWEADIEPFRSTFVSKQAEEILGHSIDRWLNESDFWENHIHPDDKKWMLGNYIKNAVENKTHEFEYRMFAADGRIVWFKDIVSVVYDNNNAKRQSV